MRFYDANDTTGPWGPFPTPPAPPPRPAIIWDRDNLADALEAIETHPRVERIRTAIASVTRLVTTQNIDVMAPELEALASALEAVKDAVALELNLAWTRRPK